MEKENLDSSQSSALQTSEFKYLNKTYEIPKGLYAWEAQLNKVIENESFTMPSELKLISYKYIRDIDSKNDLESIKTELKNKTSFFIVYKDNSNLFTIGQNEQFAANYGSIIDYMIPTSESQLQKTNATGEKKITYGRCRL